MTVSVDGCRHGLVRRPVRAQDPSDLTYTWQELAPPPYAQSGHAMNPSSHAGDRKGQKYSSGFLFVSAESGCGYRIGKSLKTWGHRRDASDVV